MTSRLKIKGFCPACGEGSLVPGGTGTNRDLHCTSKHCPRPSAAHEILADSEIHHLVDIGHTAFSLRHPLWERLDNRLLDCPVYRSLSLGTRPPLEPGKYRVWQHGSESLKFEPLHAVPE
jgi:hypothetical protein